MYTYNTTNKRIRHVYYLTYMFANALFSINSENIVKQFKLPKKKY